MRVNGGTGAAAGAAAGAGAGGDALVATPDSGSLSRRTTKSVGFASPVVDGIHVVRTPPPAPHAVGFERGADSASRLHKHERARMQAGTHNPRFSGEVGLVGATAFSVCQFCSRCYMQRRCYSDAAIS